jgi:hypothetical protein
MSSLLVMDTLKGYTSRGVTAIATIHQPRKEILDMFGVCTPARAASGSHGVQSTIRRSVGPPKGF